MSGLSSPGPDAIGEISGIADCESDENAREWTRILREKNIVLPGKETP